MLIPGFKKINLKVGKTHKEAYGYNVMIHLPI